MAGQAHAADGGAEEIRVLIPRTFHDPPVGHAHLEGPHVGSEAAIPMVVLAVDVGRDHAPERHEHRPRRDGWEEAAGKEDPVQLVE